MTGTIPARADIAAFWFEEQDEGFSRRFVPDLGEPSCFACQYDFNGRFEQVGKKAWQTGWNRSPLERCHITPKQLGGDNSLANLVLLCRSCHKEAPDVLDPLFMLKWIDARPFWLSAKCALLTSAFNDLGVCLNKLAKYEEQVLADRSWLNALGRHFGVGIKPTTIAAAIVAHFNIPMEQKNDQPHRGASRGRQ